MKKFNFLYSFLKKKMWPEVSKCGKKKKYKFLIQDFFSPLLEFFFFHYQKQEFRR